MHPEPRFRWTSQFGHNLPTRNRMYLAISHSISSGWWEQPSSSIMRSQPWYYSVLIYWRERMESWGSLAAPGDKEICWYDLLGESNPGRSHGKTMVYPLCYSCSKIKKKLYLVLCNTSMLNPIVINAPFL